MLIDHIYINMYYGNLNEHWRLMKWSQLLDIKAFKCKFEKSKKGENSRADKYCYKKKLVIWWFEFVSSCINSYTIGFLRKWVKYSMEIHVYSSELFISITLVNMLLGCCFFYIILILYHTLRSFLRQLFQLWLFTTYISQRQKENPKKVLKLKKN